MKHTTKDNRGRVGFVPETHITIVCYEGEDMDRLGELECAFATPVEVKEQEVKGNTLELARLVHSFEQAGASSATPT